MTTMQGTTDEWRQQRTTAQLTRQLAVFNVLCMQMRIELLGNSQFHKFLAGIEQYQGIQVLNGYPDTGY